MMRIKIPVLILVLALAEALHVKAATQLDFQTVDRLTYECYIGQKWDSVILVGKQALKQDIDYYYLRVRMGVAYYEKQEYFPAITHFEKARQFNSADPFVTDNLYRSYLYANRTAEARILKASQPEAITSKEESNPGAVDNVHVEAGYVLSSDASPKNLHTLMGKDSIYGSQDLYGNNMYGNFSLKFNLSKRVSLSVAYTYLNFSKEKYYQYRNRKTLAEIRNTPWGKDYIYPFITHDTSFAYHVNQHEIYLAAGIQLPAGFRLFPAVHFIRVGTELINDIGQVTTVRDTTRYVDSTHNYQFLPINRISYTYSRKDSSFFNYLVSLTVTQDIGVFNLGLSGSWSNLNGSNQGQIGFALTYFPLGNLDFYGTTSVTGFLQGNDSRLLLSQVLGVKLASWCWAEGNFYYGDYTNANIFNGSIVYNNSDVMNYRAGLNLVFVTGKHIQLSLIYQYSRKENEQVVYLRPKDPLAKPVMQINKNPYNTNSIIGGITWKL
ncbi:MAG: hypothetical protein NTU98_15180 [Bacteroidetes bacterium]|nr:hypothetical protein [Bacteroidota bacterium]